MMHAICKSTFIALGALALTTTATAQQSKNPVLSATIDDGVGSGHFTAVIDQEAGQMCYMLNIATHEAATGAHIHAGAKGERGDVVIPLATPVDGASGDCVDIGAEMAQALIAGPGNYYVNIHTGSFPQGVVRGQLRG
ncbi:hypothetical protein FHS61_001721 [Altererythrobacter atlanticus]|uniref:CHRD domain protein n=1 Tax=Croceibacterium atlanticum TaxID=1267766 RepID=A0A0F7KQU5_9SPHN|nr:CHRD domain-containing protein [Croceibacterium atlanticum]AKH41195.1 CHRD domain protein [Croceibacterium atlanticum]MBB5732712.1 hypothetical protein [Croceibacterium atlanticum]